MSAIRLSFKEFSNQDTNDLSEASQDSFPPTILLRRVAVRAFPGRQIAIYLDSRTQTYFTVPSQFSGGSHE